MSLAKAKVPLFVSACIICLGLGAAGGVFGMTFFGYSVTPAPTKPTPLQGMPPGAGGMNGMKGMKGGGMNNPKNELASLMVKMDQLSQKPLKLELTKEQQQKVLEAFQGLAEKKELSNEEAADRLKLILETLKDHQDTLQTIGVRVPGQMDPPRGPNPFQDAATQKHLESLKKKFGVGNPL